MLIVGVTAGIANEVAGSACNFAHKGFNMSCLYILSIFLTDKGFPTVSAFARTELSSDAPSR